MKIGYNWIRDICDTDLPVRELADRLTGVGLVVEEVSQVGDNDYCLDVEVTANRSDCLGIIGMARELAAATGCALRLEDYDGQLGGVAPDRCSGVAVDVDVRDDRLCPHYIAQVIENVTVAQSPAWLQDRLVSVGIRPVNNVVDITNYVLIESGQPLHAFDMDKLDGRGVVVRHAASGEKMAAIDGSCQELEPDMLVIADRRGAVAIAGVMGGKETEVSDDTRNILLECALFEPASVRKTSKRLGLSSDSSYRFERGVDPGYVGPSAKRAADLILKIAGGDVVGVVDKGGRVGRKNRITLRLSRPARLLGVDITERDIKGILERLGFSVVSETDGRIDVQAPSYRMDVSREVDLVEEIIRIYGYDKIPIKTGIPIGIAGERRYERVTDAVRSQLVGLGLFEVITFSIVDDVPAGFDVRMWAEPEGVVLRNPLVRTEDRLRKTLLFNFLKIGRHNQNRGVKDVNIFEISNIYLPVVGSRRPDEKRCLGLLVSKGFLELKGIIESVVSLLRVDGECAWLPRDFNIFEMARSAAITVDGKPCGFIGELCKELCGLFELNGSACFAELDFDMLVSRSAASSRRYAGLPGFPGMTRDLAVVVDECVMWDQIETCIKSANVTLLERIDFFDIYRGKQVDAGKKSVAFSVSFRSHERTLRGNEADSAIADIVSKLGNDLGARLRER